MECALFSMQNIFDNLKRDAVLDLCILDFYYPQVEIGLKYSF